MTTRVVSFLRVHVTSLKRRFFNKLIMILRRKKSHFKVSYDKQNHTPVIVSYEISYVVSYEIYETRRRLVS